MNERTERLRRESLAAIPFVSGERAERITAFYRENEGRHRTFFNRVTDRDTDGRTDEDGEYGLAQARPYTSRTLVALFEETHALGTGRHGHILTCRDRLPAVVHTDTGGITAVGRCRARDATRLHRRPSS